MADRKAGAARQAALKEQMAAALGGALRAVPEPGPEPAAAEAPEPKRAARPRKAEQMPAQTKAKTQYPKRIPFMTDDEQYKALAAARLEDGLEATYRLRAMVTLWMDNDQFRRRVDKIAATERARDQRARYSK